MEWRDAARYAGLLVLFAVLDLIACIVRALVTGEVVPPDTQDAVFLAGIFTVLIAVREKQP